MTEDFRRHDISDRMRTLLQAHLPGKKGLSQGVIPEIIGNLSMLLCGIYLRNMETGRIHIGGFYVAVAHSMLIAIYRILKNKIVFKDLGAKYYNQFNRERKIMCISKS